MSNANNTKGKSARRREIVWEGWQPWACNSSPFHYFPGGMQDCYLLGEVLVIRLSFSDLKVNKSFLSSVVSALPCEGLMNYPLLIHLLYGRNKAFKNQLNVEHQR